MRSPAKLILCLVLCGPASDLGAASGSTFADMLRGMATGLAILGQAGNRNATPGYYAPVIPVLPPGYIWPAAPAWGTPTWTGVPGYPGYPYAPPPPGYPGPAYYDRHHILARLQGGWETDSGGLLLIKGNMARLYLDRQHHQDLYIRADPRYIWMRPVESDQEKRYDHRIFDDKILLRDAQGRTLTLKRYRPADAPGR
jgi:hypothetical protein